MSYNEDDAALEEFYDKISEELYPEHKNQAIGEFTIDRLQSYYLENPKVMRPAVDAIQEGKKLQENGHHSAALVFFVSAIEILLKATLLRPVIYGLVHNEALAEIIVKNTLTQSGFNRYNGLLSKIFQEHAGIELSSVQRDSSSKPLLTECEKMQDIRNKIIHQGLQCTTDDAELSKLIAAAVYKSIVKPVLQSISLTVVEDGEITALDFRGN